MAVQAQQQFLSHDLGHGFGGSTGGMLLDALGVVGGCAGGLGDAVFGGEAQPRSELTSNGHNIGFLPRKRARVAPAAPGGMLLEASVLQHATAQPLAVSQGQVSRGDVQSRAVGCGAASTSGRAAVSGGACQSQGVLNSQLHLQDVEIDALVRLEMERMRLGLQEARQRHLRVVVAAVERAAAGRLRAAEAELERARGSNAEVEDKLRQLAAEGQAWLAVAKSHEAVAAGLRATLDQLLLQQPAAGLLAGDGAEDAQSCCFESNPAAGAADAASMGAAASCKSCRGAEACVLLLPCRHLCVCRACEAAVDTCPVCFATKNASLEVLLS